MRNLTRSSITGAMSFCSARGAADGVEVRRWSRFVLAATLWAIGVAPAVGAEPSATQVFEAPNLTLESHLNVSIQHPKSRSIVPEPRGCGTYVAGRAGVRDFDILFVLDTSGSTAAPSGGDIDGDGTVGRASLDAQGNQQNSDAGDSIMAAEVAAAKRLLLELDSHSTRVGLVGFAGTERQPLAWLFRPPPAAQLLQALTADYTEVEAALDAVLHTRPAGATDIAAAIDEAWRAFSADEDAASRRRLVMLFTDGFPTLPFGPKQEARNVLAVFEAAARSRDASVEVHTFAIGAEAVEWPLALIETSERTGGTFFPVRHPADLISFVQSAGVGDLASVTLRNATTGAVAIPFSLSGDGAFQGFVPLVAGENRIEVSAVTTEGSAKRTSVVLERKDEAAPLALSPELIKRQTALLQDCLRYAKRRRRAAEQTEAEQARRQLVIEMERERARARERAEKQRKRLELEPEWNP